MKVTCAAKLGEFLGRPLRYRRVKALTAFPQESLARILIGFGLDEVALPQHTAVRLSFTASRFLASLEALPPIFEAQPRKQYQEAYRKGKAFRSVLRRSRRLEMLDDF